ncbi:hypothetical protein S077_001321 [Salmonella enterica subsp. enterica]|nr:hypothetical protein [Salmonella enterica subsp. enterica serovar Paratyphi B]EDV4531332.1 hypothetical protein [Salmonella enterica subsp. enterica]
MMAQFTSALSAYREHSSIRLTIIRHKKNRALKPGLYDSETKINARFPACAFAHSGSHTSTHFSLYPARR